MFCVKCGKKIPDDVKFCPYCGTEVKNLEIAVDLTENMAAKVPGKPDMDLGGMQPFGRTNMPTYGMEPKGDLDPYGSVREGAAGSGSLYGADNPAKLQEPQKYPWEIYEERRAAQSAERHAEESAGSDDEEGDLQGK